MHSVHIALWLMIASCVSSHPCMRTCVLRLDCFLLACLVFYLVSLFYFQPFLMPTSAPNERSMSNPLCNSSLGTVVTSDYVTPLTLQLRKFESRSCSCGAPVVLGGFVSRLGFLRPRVFDGAGVPWLITGTHQREAPSTQDDGIIRGPTFCGWCCHRRHVVMVVSESCNVLPSNTIQIQNS